MAVHPEVPSREYWGSEHFKCNYDIGQLSLSKCLPAFYQEIITFGQDVIASNPKNKNDVLEQIIWNNKLLSLIRNLCTCSIGAIQEFSKSMTSLIHSKIVFHPPTPFAINLTQDVISYSTLALLTPSLKLGKTS